MKYGHSQKLNLNLINHKWHRSMVALIFHLQLQMVEINFDCPWTISINYNHPQMTRLNMVVDG